MAEVHLELPVQQLAPGGNVELGVNPVHPEGEGLSLRRDSRYRRALAVADVLAAYVALVLVLRYLPGATVSLKAAVVVIAPAVVLGSKVIGLYDRDQHRLSKTTVDEVPSILYLALLYVLAVWLAQAALLGRALDRVQVLGLVLVTFALIFVLRVVARTIARRTTPPERCAVLGSAAAADRIAKKVSLTPGLHAAVVARLSCLLSGPEGKTVHSPYPGSSSGPASISQALTDYQIERVIVAMESFDPEEALESIRLIKTLGVKVSVLPRLLEVVGSASIFDDVEGMALLGVRRYGLSKSSQLLKRTTDIIGSAAGLLLLSPVLLFLAIAIKLDSPGPVLFRQSRIGWHGARFWIYKFRSMVPDAELRKSALCGRNEAEAGLFKIRDDPRVTRVGRWIRKSSLDELPQLLNVILGDMSLVGPRPFVPEEDALFCGWERGRLSVRPGMTGQWQIFGSSRIPRQEMVKIDYLYAANWSIWLDLKILMRTLPYVLTRRGM